MPDKNHEVKATMPQISKWSPAVVEMKMRNAYRYLFRQTMIAKGTWLNNDRELEVNPELASYYEAGTRVFHKLLEGLK